MNNLVSIIVNCYNGEKYLKKCLQSIISQTYENWEVIFMDNCSTDNSKKIFQSFNEKKFFYFTSEKLINLSKARNLAISKSNGNYICFLDTDDYWNNNKIYNQIRIFKSQDAALVFSNFIVHNNQNGKKKKIY